MPLLDTMRFTYIMPHEKRKLSAFAEGFLLFICVTWLVLGTHLLLTFYSPFCWGDTLIYMDLCEPKSFEFLKIWRYMDIYKDTWQVEMPTIPSFIR